MHLWKKSVPAARADLWTERLTAAVSAERLVVVGSPAGRNVRLEIYCDLKREADALVRRFGGGVREVRPESWQPAPATGPGRPLAIGGQLWITGREEELTSLRAAHPGKPVLCVPAAMAFGTGEHATTAMCLRLLAASAKALRESGGPWDLLDLGSGSGILALAGKMFGASDVLGLDNDPHAVRTARGNALLNGVRGVRFRQADLLANWQPERAAWPVVTANLFSDLLTTLLPQIRVALPRGGLLIASGVLKSQAAELETAFRKNGLDLIEKRRRGKWTAFLAIRQGGSKRQSTG